MQVLGYIGYAILLFFAVLWVIGVRRHLELGLHSIMGALFYMVAAVLLAVFDINKAHSWWLIPAGYGFIWICVRILSAEIPLLSGIIKFLGSVYANIIRKGIPSEAIKEAQTADLKKIMDEWQRTKKTESVD